MKNKKTSKTSGSKEDQKPQKAKVVRPTLTDDDIVVENHFNGDAKIGEPFGTDR